MVEYYDIREKNLSAVLGMRNLDHVRCASIGVILQRKSGELATAALKVPRESGSLG